MSDQKKNKQKQSTAQPTMHDVARHAGVSQMTVSRVMRDAGYASDSVREKVLQAARKLGYVHNRLAGGQSNYDNPLVGVIVPTLDNRVFNEVLSGVSEALSASGLRPVFGVSDYSLEREEELVFDLLSWRPRGLIVAGLEHTDNVRRIIEQTGVRIAEIMDTDGEPMSACFGFSQSQAAETMADHLIARGYRKIAYVAGLSEVDLRARKRFAAFQRRIEEGGGAIVAQRVFERLCTMIDGRTFTAELLADKANRPDAIYFANDDLAAGGLMHCLVEGIDVPGDVAIAGFNGLNFVEALPLRITTTRTPRFDIGAAAADWIASDQAGSAKAKTISRFETELIVGETS